MRLLKQQSPVQIIIDQKQLQNVEYFHYLSTMITNDARCTRGITFKISVKGGFDNKKAFHS